MTAVTGAAGTSACGRTLVKASTVEPDDGGARDALTSFLDAPVASPAPALSCPPAAAARTTCGCGCCGGAPQDRACYYPALGETVEAIPDPRPANCATAGCSRGTSHLCCADPGEPTSPERASYCAQDLATQIPRILVVKRTGNTCTTVNLSLPNVSPSFRVSAPQDFAVASATRGACGGAATTGSAAIGAIGTVAARVAPAPLRLDIHVALFFDVGTAIAAAERIDVQDLALAPGGCAP